MTGTGASVLTHQSRGLGRVRIHVHANQVPTAQRTDRLVGASCFGYRPDDEIAVGHQAAQGLVVHHEDRADSPVTHRAGGFADRLEYPTPTGPGVITSRPWRP